MLKRRVSVGTVTMTMTRPKINKFDGRMKLKKTSE